MGEIINTADRFAVKTRAAQKLRTNLTILELQGETGDSEKYGRVIALFMKLDDMVVARQKLTRRQTKVYKVLQTTLDNHFGTTNTIKVLRAWNEGQARRDVRPELKLVNK